jgi:hypothetical protein
MSKNTVRKTASLLTQERSAAAAANYELPIWLALHQDGTIPQATSSIVLSSWSSVGLLAASCGSFVIAFAQDHTSRCDEQPAGRGGHSAALRCG